MIQRYFCVNDTVKEIVEVDIQAQNTQEPIELFSWLYTIFINSDTIKVLSASEQQDMQQCKQMLKGKLAKNGIYAGCKIVGSWHEIYFYLKSAKGIESKIRDILSNFNYTFESNAVKDKSWKFYEMELLPNEYQQHHIQNRQIIDELIDAGDEIAIKREVEHYIVFDTSSLRDKFYNILQEHSLSCKEMFDDDDAYNISLAHMQTLDFDDMCKFTDNLVKLSNQFHARYIGWNTKLVKDI